MTIPPLKLRKLIDSNSLALGSWITIWDNKVTEILCQAEFDWLAIDMEHSTIGIEKVGDLIASYNPDIIGLAKYMRILSPEFVGRFENKIINIHHSFLPAFIGAKPYHQAFERGVKIIGATAHFVNNELDEGPIILQDVTSVTHANTAEMMAKMGKDVEKTVFSKALQLASEHKLFINGNKTVVFS